MSRWIDADELGASVIKNTVFDKGDVIKLIEDAPSIDIVRCSECKYAHMTYGGECKYCDKWSLEDSLYLDGDFFCSYGCRDSEKPNNSERSSE